MWVTETTVARTLVCIAVFMLPMQGLSSASCCCASDETCCQQAQSKTCCCSARKVSEGRCCCSGRAEQPAHSCCGKTRNKAIACKCGLNCQCEHTSQPSPAPLPVERNSQTEKVAGEALSLSLETNFKRSDTACPKAMMADGHSLDAVDRCVSLCRLIL